MKKALSILPILLMVFGVTQAQNDKISFDVKILPAETEEAPVDMSFFIDKKKMAVKLNSEEANNLRIIFNTENNELISLMNVNGRKMGMKTTIPKVEDADADGSSQKKADYKVTGNSKKINGYTSKEVIVTTEDGKAELWLTDEVDFDYFSAMKVLQTGNKSNMDDFSELAKKGIKGFPMMVKNYDENGKLQMTMEITKINHTVDPAVFSTEGYEISTMPGTGQY